MQSILTSLEIIAVFKNIINDILVSSFINVISALYEDDFEFFLMSYSDFILNLYENENSLNLYNYVKSIIYADENIISKTCGTDVTLNEQILETANYELSLLDKLLLIDFENIKATAMEKFPANKEIISHLPLFLTDREENFNLSDIIQVYKKNGYGIFACYNAFKYNETKEIIPVKYFETISFKQLKNYNYQKEIIYNNTKAFLEDREANNILLYGDRGCGKSSTVKALINEFCDYNLKIIQISKDSLMYLSDLYEEIRNLPLKFIIFADDISFEENDKNFSSIKAALEGSISEKPKNVIIYATTNRMHLVKESFSARVGNEIHCNDTIDETVSLSDRFGIILTFSILTKNEYLDILKKMAKDSNITINDDFNNKAEQFAIQKGIRTPRIARQFLIDYNNSSI